MTPKYPACQTRATRFDLCAGAVFAFLRFADSLMLLIDYGLLVIAPGSQRLLRSGTPCLDEYGSFVEVEHGTAR